MCKISLDELPKIFNIFTGKMTIIGSRPALWNQYDRIAERDKYGANDITPELTGWAQINGRDTIEIADKARYDGEYVKKISFSFDCKCFFGTIVSVIKHDRIPEDGTKKAGIQVVDKTNFIRRYFDGVKYAFISMKYWKKIKDADVIYFQSNPTILFPMLLLKIFKRMPIVYSIYDVFPGHVFDIGAIKNKFIYNCLKLLQKSCYKLANFQKGTLKCPIKLELF